MHQNHRLLIDTLLRLIEDVRLFVIWKPRAPILLGRPYVVGVGEGRRPSAAACWWLSLPCDGAIRVSGRYGSDEEGYMCGMII